MTLDEALDLVIARTRHERYRWLCSDDNPDAETREGYRAYVLRQAAGQPEPTSDPDDALQGYILRHGCCGG